MPEVTDFQLFAAMARYGGSFAKAIAEAATRADANNMTRLKHAFPELIDEYRDMAALIALKEKR